MRALICDDDRISRFIVRKILERLGVEEIAEAVDGTDALKALSANRFDLAMIDLHMPFLDGFDVVKAVRSRRSMDGMRVIIMTADSREQVVREALSLGVSGYLLKPLKPDVAFVRISDALRPPAANSAPPNPAVRM